MRADRNENACCASRNCRNKSCFALLTIRKEVTHRIPVNAFRLQAYRPWKITVVSVHSAKQLDPEPALPDRSVADGQRSAEEKATWTVQNHQRRQQTGLPGSGCQGCRSLHKYRGIVYSSQKIRQSDVPEDSIISALPDIQSRLCNFQR